MDTTIKLSVRITSLNETCLYSTDNSEAEAQTVPAANSMIDSGRFTNPHKYTFLPWLPYFAPVFPTNSAYFIICKFLTHGALAVTMTHFIRPACLFVLYLNRTLTLTASSPTSPPPNSISSLYSEL
ncbi:hypothetical protein T01_9750 [Trichinella spiralis]|uniref:Uncharacterized protein n=1 Tax=Trichinella spiralis TaxID=6334 RepID=A0A0V1AS57_TRISP|nr:hypothetical protein T01_9750 [Trichinella spiralis]